MSVEYEDRKDSEIYGSRLIIHKRRIADNDIYWFRAKIAGVSGYIRRSCKTEDAAETMMIARSAYGNLLL
jgi:hypothetical protein